MKGAGEVPLENDENSEILFLFFRGNALWDQRAFPRAPPRKRLGEKTIFLVLFYAAYKRRDAISFGIGWAG
jgi:hypothetical protein